MKASELMTRDPAVVRPDQSVREVALLMRDCDCGCLPVEDPSSHTVIGVVTDRDIVTRAIAEAGDADTEVREVMSANPSCAHADDDVSRIEEIMCERQVRRVPVVDQRGHAIGIIAQADLARAADGRQRLTEHEIAAVVAKVSAAQEVARSREVKH